MTDSQLNITVIGLGLMGGSFALALRGFQDCRLTGYDTNRSVLEEATARGAIDRAAESLTDAVREADLVMFCTGPHSIPEDMTACFPYLKSGCVITDICGVKKAILAFVAQHLSPGIDYIGLHPMAGKEVGGFANADAKLFQNAGFLIIPPPAYKKHALRLIEALSRYVGAGRLHITDAEEHDEVIAYTSDLMHVAAAALCRRFPEAMTMTHTAGAFRDCTRVATLDPALWTDLFTQNAEYVLSSLTRYIEDLAFFKQALEQGDLHALYDFLAKASGNKKEMLSR